MRSKQTYNLGDLQIKRLALKPVSDDGNVFEFMLPVTGKNIHFKFLTGKEESERNRHRKRERKSDRERKRE